MEKTNYPMTTKGETEVLTHNKSVKIKCETFFGPIRKIEATGTDLFAYIF